MRGGIAGVSESDARMQIAKVMNYNGKHEHAIEMLREAGARKPMLSGSGSAVYTLAPTAAERDELTGRIAPVPEFEIFACAFRSGAAWTH